MRPSVFPLASPACVGEPAHREHSAASIGSQGGGGLFHDFRDHAALAADPRHTRTWQYYGLWHLEQGNRLKAEDHLEKIHLICGNTTCEDYTSLKEIGR